MRTGKLTKEQHEELERQHEEFLASLTPSEREEFEQEAEAFIQKIRVKNEQLLKAEDALEYVLEHPLRRMRWSIPSWN